MLHRKRVVFGLVGLTLLLGCERRVDEPLPEVRPLGESAVAPAAARDREPPPANPQGDRCVRPSPKVVRSPPPKGPDPKCPRDPEKPPALRAGTVAFPNGESVSVEIAERDVDRQRGLMYRKTMPDRRGMIFSFSEKSDHAFWMHNTCIPLDMLFIDADGLIVGIEENTPTMSDDTFAVGCPSKFVLELNAGYCRAHGIAAGQRVKIDGV